MVQLTKKRKMTKSKISSKSKKKFNKSRKNGMKTNKLIRDGGGFGIKSFFRKQQRPGESPPPRNSVKPPLLSGPAFAAQRRKAATDQINSMRVKALRNRADGLSSQATPVQRQAVTSLLASSKRYV